MFHAKPRPSSVGVSSAKGSSRIRMVHDGLHPVLADVALADVGVLVLVRAHVVF